MPRYRVEISRTDYYTVEVEASHESEARENAIEAISREENPEMDQTDGFETCGCTEIEAATETEPAEDEDPEEVFDERVDDATHAVMEQFGRLNLPNDVEQNSELMIRVNDALTQIFQEYKKAGRT